MTLLEKIELLMKENNLNKRQLSLQTDIPYSTIDGIFKVGYKNMRLPTLAKLCDFFGVTMESMAYDEKEIEYKPKYESIMLNNDEQDIILKYKGLDDSGKLFIKKAIDHESDRMAEKIEQKITNNRIYAYYNKIAAAGSGFYFDDIPADTIEAPYYPNADFIIGVSGDSMEPDYFDGDNVYVRRSQDIPIGSVGIFTIGNECFIKERGEDGLISRNPKYGIINGTEDVRAVGEVLGKVEK